MGSRGAKTLRRLRARLMVRGPKLFAVFSDCWKVYRKVVPENLLCQSKKVTWPAENQNTSIRHYLARFHRKTLCYSKSPAMAELSLYLHLNRADTILI
jgi:insertion element IS1 protein InsB